MTLGKRLKNSREKLGLQQKYVAELIGVKNNTLSSYESDKRQPDYETLQKLANLYHMSIEYLITGEERSKEDFKGNLFFYDLEDLSEKEIEDIKSYIEFVKHKAKKNRQDEEHD